ncbi:hypothetical protein D9619_005201 [Psilocybe cf. subviscida]|uniref:Uncharacterized protein n=1 Tax=Psilocybe cf. subviscida TaxID=2480587 RepID=A0A8H5FBQ6_9AGAR|nr:hypothetical protein D9619_005201 [Psilocybe cf. subviscida]
MLPWSKGPTFRMAEPDPITAARREKSSLRNEKRCPKKKAAAASQGANPELPQPVSIARLPSSSAVVTPILNLPPPKGQPAPKSNLTPQPHDSTVEFHCPSSDCEQGPQEYDAFTTHRNGAGAAPTEFFVRGPDYDLEENHAYAQIDLGVRNGTFELAHESDNLTSRHCRHGMAGTVTGTADRFRSPPQRRIDLENPDRPAERVHLYFSPSSRQHISDSLWNIWDERIRLISQCVITSETISSLAEDVEMSRALLNSAKLRASRLNGCNSTDDISTDNNEHTNDDYHAQHTRIRFTREQSALVARLEAEKTVYTALQRAMGVESTAEEGEQIEEEENKEQEEMGKQEKIRRERLERQKDKADSLAAEIHLGQEHRARREYELVQSRAMTARLGDQVLEIKSVLGEVHRMTLERGASKERIYACQITSSKRKRLSDTDADARDEPAGISSGSSRSRLTSPCQVPASKEEARTVRHELEKCIHQVTEMQSDLEQTQNDADGVDMTADLLQVAVDRLRAERVNTAQEKEEADVQQQAEVHAEVSEELVQITQQTINLDTHVGEVTGTLTGLLLHVAEMEEMVEQEGRRRDEARVRVEQMKEKMKSYAALQAQNAVSMSALGATLDACSRQLLPLSPASGTPSPVLSLPCTSTYPLSQDIAEYLAPYVADVALPLLESTRSQVARIVEETRSTMLQALNLQLARPPDGTPSLELHEQKPVLASPLVNESSHDNDNNKDVVGFQTATSLRLTPTPTVSLPIFSTSMSPTSCAPSIPPASDPQLAFSSVVRVQSVESPRYTPPLEDNASIGSLTSLGANYAISDDVSAPLSLGPRESSAAPINLPTEFDSSPNMETLLPEVDTSAAVEPSPPGEREERARVSENTLVPQQLGCSFLTDPNLQGIPVRLQPKDIKSRVCRPFAFVRIIPATPTVLNLQGIHSNDGTINLHTTVEVRDGRKGPRYNTKRYKFPLDALCYVPPTAMHQTVVCAAPGAGVDPAQRYYVLHFDGNEGGQCVVRKDPKVLTAKAEMISFPTNLLAQMVPPTFASRLSAPLPPLSAAVSSHASSGPTEPAAVAEGTKKTTIGIKPRVLVPVASRPKVHFDHEPPMWLKDPAFSGYRVQLKQQDGDGSILELIAVDISASTVEVRPLLSSTLRKTLPLNELRHVVVCAPYQMVVAISGDLKGTIMKVGTYGKDECTLYSPLKRRSHWERHLEPRYKTADLAVVLPPRK